LNKDSDHSPKQNVLDPMDVVTKASRIENDCIVYITSSMDANEGVEYNFICEIDGLSYSLNLDESQNASFKEKMSSGELVSGSSILKNVIIDSSDSDSVILSPEVNSIEFENPEAAGEPMVEKGEKWTKHFYGTHYVLVIRVIAADNANTDNAEQISDNIFGTDGDQINLISQTTACSYGQLDLVAGANPNNPISEEHYAAPGVIEVEIDIAVTGKRKDQSAVQNAVIEAAETLTGQNMKRACDHLMIILEGKKGKLAYGIVNGYLSVYYGDAYSFAAVQIHEVFHNLGFGHSGGLNGKEYSDHTGLVSTFYFQF